MPNQSESRIKAEIHKALERRGAYWAPIPQGSYGKPGDPDMIVCYKGRFIGMEGKTPVGRLSPIQEHRGRQIEAAGGIFAVVRSVDDAMRVLDAVDVEVEECSERRRTDL